MTADQLDAGIPIVVPQAFGFEGIDDLGVRPPAAAVMGNGVLQSTAVAAGHIPDHTIDIKQQNSEIQRSRRNERLVG